MQSWSTQMRCIRSLWPRHARRGSASIRTSVEYQSDGHVQIDKYVLLTRDTHFFDALWLKSGRYLTAAETLGGSRFLSTVDTRDRDQVGVLRVFAGGTRLAVRPLKSAFDRLPVAGQYFAEAPSATARAAFVASLVSRLNTSFRASQKRPYVAADFGPSQAFGGGSPAEPQDSILMYIGFMIVGVIVIAVAYSIFDASKTIAS